MVLPVPVSPETEEKLRARAAAQGIDVPTLAARAIEHFVSKPSLDEILAPLRREFESTGMTEDELIEFLEVVKHEARGVPYPPPSATGRT